MTGGKRREYTGEQKDEAVRLVRVSGQSVAQVARDLGLPENTLWNWAHRARIDAGEGPPEALTTAEREELRRLRRENRRLRMERDFLKKATAFFARETDEDSK
jgi:transposase